MSKTKKIWILWAAAYLICTVCGFVPAKQGTAHGLLFLLLSLAFFVPPGMLLYRAAKRGNKKVLQQVRNLSMISLGSTLAVIILNFLAVRASEAWGQVLNWILIVVSTPMVASMVWVISLFGWACLLMTSLNYLKRK